VGNGLGGSLHGVVVQVFSGTVVARTPRGSSPRAGTDRRASRRILAQNRTQWHQKSLIGIIAVRFDARWRYQSDTIAHLQPGCAGGVLRRSFSSSRAGEAFVASRERHWLHVVESFAELQTALHSPISASNARYLAVHMIAEMALCKTRTRVMIAGWSS
jgi:hypothetical protein